MQLKLNTKTLRDLSHLLFFSCLSCSLFVFFFPNAVEVRSLSLASALPEPSFTRFYGLSIKSIAEDQEQSNLGLLNRCLV